MLSRQELARTALRASFEARRKAAALFEDPICIYDLAERLGLEVWFVAGASFGGMYVKDSDQLFIPSERHAGRKAFTCAHELAHWWFNHGTRIDKLDFDKSDHEVPEECLANLFGGYILMPRHAVVDAFRRRQIQPQYCTPIQIYEVACQLGVGYETLLKHMRYSLNLITHSRLIDLQGSTPKDFRIQVLGNSENCHMVLAGSNWRKVSIDLEVGDFAVLPKKAILNGTAAQIVGDCPLGVIAKGVRPGIAQAIMNSSSWAAMLRVSRKKFHGRSAYRHLEDPDETT